jgi:hypothetical protein
MVAVISVVEVIKWQILFSYPIVPSVTRYLSSIAPVSLTPLIKSPDSKSQGRIIRVHLPLLYPYPHARYRDETDKFIDRSKLSIDPPTKSPQLIKISQGRITRVHLPLLYPHLPARYRDETKKLILKIKSPDSKSQGRIIRVHLPLLYPHPHARYRDETDKLISNKLLPISL